MSCSSVYVWVVKFKAGHKSLHGEAQSGRPNTALADEMIVWVDNVIKGDKLLCVEDIVLKLDISKDFAG